MALVAQFVASMCRCNHAMHTLQPKAGKSMLIRLLATTSKRKTIDNTLCRFFSAEGLFFILMGARGIMGVVGRRQNRDHSKNYYPYYPQKPYQGRSPPPINPKQLKASKIKKFSVLILLCSLFFLLARESLRADSLHCFVRQLTQLLRLFFLAARKNANKFAFFTRSAASVPLSTPNEKQKSFPFSVFRSPFFIIFAKIIRR